MFSVNTIQIKRGALKPTPEILAPFELGYCTQGTDRGLYLNNNGTIVKIGDEILSQVNDFIYQVTEKIGFGNHTVEKAGLGITIFRPLED